MREFLKSEVPDVPPASGPGIEIPEHFKFRIPSTGALLTIYNAIEILSRYCYSLPRDRFYIPNPEYLIAQGPNGFACEVHMPRNVRKDCLYLRGSIQPSAIWAKRDVAFRMVKLLYTLGEINDNLHCSNVTIDTGTGKPLRLPTIRPLFMQRQVRKHYVAVPSHFEGRWAPNSVYFVNTIKIRTNGTDKVLPVGFLTMKPIMHSGETFETFMDTEPCSVQIISFQKPIIFDAGNLSDLHVFHYEFFKAVLRSKFTEHTKWATLCVPLLDHGTVDLNTDPREIVDWEAMYFAGNVDRQDLSLFRGGKACFDEVSDIVLFDKCRYSRSHQLLEILAENNPTNIVEKRMVKYGTVEKLYRKRLQYKGDINLEQFVMRGKPIGYPYRCNIRDGDLPEAILIPELCTINPVKFRHLKHSKQFPLLMQYIQHRLLMEDLLSGTAFPSFPHAFQANINTLQEAFLTPSAQLHCNYERLETLGDSFLKVHLTLHLFVLNPFRHEGFLTQQRADLENNRNLKSAANKLGIEKYILSNALVRNTYIPPNLDTVQVQDISDKGIADVVEASIAACYLNGGESAAAKCIAFFLGDSFKPNWNSYYLHWCSHTLPQNLLEPSMISACKLVEKRIGYQFKKIDLLAEALTHPSAISTTSINSYERLEFLGDAVLGVVITRFVFELTPPLGPGKMSELRTELYQNQFLAAVATKLGLPKFMSHMSVPLGTTHTEWISKFDKRYRETEELIAEDADLFDPTVLMFWNHLETAPKTLGDLYEAMLGAVFLDSGFKLEPVKQIIQRTLLDLWWPRMKPLIDGSKGLVTVHAPSILKQIIEKNQCSQFLLTTQPLLEGSYLCEYCIHGNKIVSVCLDTKKDATKFAAIQALEYVQSHQNLFEEVCDCEKVDCVPQQEHSDDETESLEEHHA
jgi:dsRNA-specific ribonuclease